MFVDDLQALAARGVHALTHYSLHVNERTPVARSLRDDEHLDLARIMRWRALAQRGAEALGYTQTRWHTFKRLDSRALTHERRASGGGREDGAQPRRRRRGAVFCDVGRQQRIVTVRATTSG
jgi:oxygen-independent coproporphyrinogen-3 oxidase